MNPYRRLIRWLARHELAELEAETIAKSMVPGFERVLIEKGRAELWLRGYGMRIVAASFAELFRGAPDDKKNLVACDCYWPGDETSPECWMEITVRQKWGKSVADVLAAADCEVLWARVPFEPEC